MHVELLDNGIWAKWLIRVNMYSLSLSDLSWRPGFVCGCEEEETTAQSYS